MKEKKERPIKGWWFPYRVEGKKAFVRDDVFDGNTRSDVPVELGGLRVRTGQVQQLPEGTIECCHYGLHGSRDIADAAFLANQLNVACRVESWGDVDEQTDKYASRCRRIVRMYWLPERVRHEWYNTADANTLMREIRRQDRARKEKAAKKAGAK